LTVGSLAYRAAVTVRNAAFDRGWLRQVRLPCRVISVGNLTVGGTGKTACVTLVTQKLVGMGKRVAVLCNLEPAKLRGVQSNGMVLAAEDEHDVGLRISPEDAPLGAQVLGVRGAPRLTFSEFQRHKIRVAEGGTVIFHGAEGTRAVPLRVGDAPVRVDKPFPPGTPVR
ncbi:MAG: tetraacyldisaccharide 4'-kinase, partial [Candidatus Thermoplasmatota archaeon]